MERKALAVGSLLLSLIAPLLLTIAIFTLRVNVKDPQFDFQNYALNTIGLFLLLIFVAPVATILSLLMGYVAYKQSQFAARKLAIASFVVTGIALALLIVFVSIFQGALPSATAQS